jgi:hypothetical protein
MTGHGIYCLGNPVRTFGYPVSGNLYEMLDHFDGCRPVDEVLESLVAQNKRVPKNGARFYLIGLAIYQQL